MFSRASQEEITIEKQKKARRLSLLFQSQLYIERRDGRRLRCGQKKQQRQRKIIFVAMSYEEHRCQDSLGVIQ